MRAFATPKRNRSTARSPARHGRLPVTPRRAAQALQRAEVRHILHGPRLQPTLTVAAPDDVYEREADRVAAAVMRMPAPDERIQRMCSECEEESLVVKSPAGEAPEVSGGLEARIQTLRGGGQSLPQATRAFFEPRFGEDLGGVRVHADPRAARLARAVQARAFTVGQDIVFGPGEYRPASTDGRNLLAHELVHVVQQGVDLRRSATHASSARSAIAIEGGSAPVQIMRREIFSSTMQICHRVLFSRTFSVSEGSVTVIADAHWEGPSVGSSQESCGAPTYPMTLTEEGLIFDSEVASCDFRVDRADIRTWTGVPPGDYHLTIWPNNTNPYCCLVGTIQVLEQSGVSGPSCGGRTRREISALDVLHTALDAAGLFPALGVIPDAVNAGIYSIEGDWTNAGISAAAMLPFLGQGATLTRYGLKATERGLLAVGREGIEAGIRAARGGGRLARHLRSKMRRIRNAIAAGGNRGVAGSVTTDEAMQLGVEFVGPNYRVMSGGRGIVSQDGLRQFRFPSAKRGIDPMTGEPFSRTGVQANFEQRATASGEWTSNVHLDVGGR